MKLYYTAVRAPLGWKCVVTKEMTKQLTQTITNNYNEYFETMHGVSTAEEVLRSLKITSKMNNIVLLESDDECDGAWPFIV